MKRKGAICQRIMGLNRGAHLHGIMGLRFL